MRTDNVEYRVRRAEHQIRLGDKIRKLREANGKGQAWLAEQLCLTTVSVSNVETGSQSIYAHDLSGWAKALGCSMLELLDFPVLEHELRKVQDERSRIIEELEEEKTP